MAKKPELKVWVTTNIANTTGIIVAAYSKYSAVQIIHFGTGKKITKKEFESFYNFVSPDNLTRVKVTENILLDRPAIYLYSLGKVCCTWLGTKED